MTETCLICLFFFQQIHCWQMTLDKNFNISVTFNWTQPWVYKLLLRKGVAENLWLPNLPMSELTQELPLMDQEGVKNHLLINLKKTPWMSISMMYNILLERILLVFQVPPTEYKFFLLFSYFCRWIYKVWKPSFDISRQSGVLTCFWRRSSPTP